VKERRSIEYGIDSSWLIVAMENFRISLTLVDSLSLLCAGHVIEREKVNKMTLQNVSIVLSPTMQISHRVLYCFFEFSGSLFGGVQLKKYVPPISGPTGLLPESPEGIEEEMKKQAGV
jgi:hypothetical protein